MEFEKKFPIFFKASMERERERERKELDWKLTAISLTIIRRAPFVKM